MRELSNADVITLYLPTNLMDQLLPQLAQVKRGTRQLSRTFSSLPIFRPKHRSGSSRQMTVTRTKSISGPRRFTKENDGR